MASAIWQLMQGLKGVLYGPQVKLDLVETSMALREYLAPVLAREDADAGLVAWKLCEFFLPSSVLDEMENSGDVSHTIEDPVLAVVEPLLVALKADPHIRQYQRMDNPPH
jgi:hypothetical protein